MIIITTKENQKNYPDVTRYCGDSTKQTLWGIAAGRCEMCNCKLYEDSTYGVTGNYAQRAHIHAVSEGGPRHIKLSNKELNNISNLILLCPVHHKMIDENPELFTAAELAKTKNSHEKRVQMVTEISEDQTCLIISYFSNIDSLSIQHEDTLFKQAVINDKLIPLQDEPVNLNTSSSMYIASKNDYYNKARELEANYMLHRQAINGKRAATAIFALAPQPLLMKLGTLVNDQYNVKVYQCHRNGHKWKWPDESEDVNYHTSVKDGVKESSTVALNISLSADIVDNRIYNVLGGDVPIYKIAMDNPNRNFVTSIKIQDAFVQVFRDTMESIKNTHKNCNTICVFPCMPVSLAVRLGMDYMPKTDPKLVVFDENKNKGGFIETITIGGKVND